MSDDTDFLKKMQEEYAKATLRQIYTISFKDEERKDQVIERANMEKSEDFTSFVQIDITGTVKENVFYIPTIDIKMINKSFKTEKND